jgi:hypothetical protein
LNEKEKKRKARVNANARERIMDVNNWMKERKNIKEDGYERIWVNMDEKGWEMWVLLKKIERRRIRQ